MRDNFVFTYYLVFEIFNLTFDIEKTYLRFYCLLFIVYCLLFTVYYICMRVTKLLTISLVTIFFIFLFVFAQNNMAYASAKSFQLRIKLVDKKTSKPINDAVVKVYGCNNISMNATFSGGLYRTPSFDTTSTNWQNNIWVPKSCTGSDDLGSARVAYWLKGVDLPGEVQIDIPDAENYIKNNASYSKQFKIENIVGNQDDALNPPPAQPPAQPPVVGNPSVGKTCTMFGCFEPETAFENYIDAVFTWSLGAAFVAATAILIYAGFMYMTSGGNPDAITNAKGWIFSALSSVALLALAKLIFSIFGIKWFE
ncbi:hypothetical protein AUK11_03865 [bacterium CG2_30_37_16]|nr:MAG: hypothetical protein AUK11_03865 [bacterium CG2_30_37_16]PJB07281.1 MAG: hypothetical protein CO123_00380 [bacterium (Candidatus Howlettbacteria) CG_4_9_14_3_um_filter_37_10]